MLIVAVMLFAMAAATIPAGAVQGEIDFVDALYFDVKPTLDGIVSEAEWGEVSVEVRQNEAATIDDTEPVNNRFFMRNTAAVPGFDIDNLSMSYSLWLRWDENCYYIAVKVKDPDGHSLKNGRNFTWNGDSFQTRIDAGGYNASNPKGSEYYDAEKDGKPWSRANIPDFVAGFVESAGGFSELWENETNKGITTFLGGTAEVSIAPTGAAYSTDTSGGYTTYEIAIPWGYIDTNSHEYSVYSRKNPNGGIGREYGMSTVVYNADGTSGQAMWNAALSWGSGIVNAQQDDYTKTCAGSNCVTLSGDKVSENYAYSAGYTNIPGGYNPPYVVPNYATSIDTSRLIGPLTYDSEADMAVYGDNYDNGPDGAMGGHRVQDTDGNWVVQWNEDTGELFNSPTNSGLNETNYLSSRGMEDGTYAFDGKGDYTMEFDIKVTDTQTFQEGYGSELYNWFGGSSTYDYLCGYSFDNGKFFIKENASGNELTSVAADFSLNEWHHWVFQYFKGSSSFRFYFDPKMGADGLVDPDEKPLFEMRYRYFDMPGVESNEVIFRRLNCQIMMDNVKFYNFVDFTKKGEAPIETRDPVNNGGYVPATPVETTTEVTVGVTKRDDGTFAVNIPNEDKYKAANVTAVSFTLDLTKAEGKLTYKGVEGVAEDAITATDNGDGTVTLKVNDLKIFADVETGKDVFLIILAPADGVDLTADQVKDMVSVKATVTTTSAATGDAAYIYITAAILLIAAIGTGVVLYTRKRRHIDF